MSLKNYFIPLAILLLTGAFTTARAPQSVNVWTTCYSEQKNTVFFNALGTKRKSRQCSGRTSFRGPYSYKLVRPKSGKKAFSPIHGGIQKIVALPDGRRLLVSQWNNMSSTNLIMVSEPNFANGKVKQICNMDNSGSSFSTRYNQKKRKLEVLVSAHKGTDGFTLHKVWKSCSI